MTEQQWRDSTDTSAMLRFLTARGQQPAGSNVRSARHPSDRKLRLACCAMLRTVWASLPDQQCRSAVRAAEQLADQWDRRLWSLHVTAMNARLHAYANNGRDFHRTAAVMHALTNRDDGVPQAPGQVELSLRGSPGLADALRDVANPFLTSASLPPEQDCQTCHGSGTFGTLGGLSKGCYRCSPGPNKRGTGKEPCPWMNDTTRRLARSAYSDRLDGQCPECSGDGTIGDPYDRGVRSRCDRCGGAGSGDGRLDDSTLAVLADALEDAGWPIDEACPACNGKGMVRYGDGGFSERPCWGCGDSYSQHPGTGRVPNPVLAQLRSPGPHWLGCWALDLVTGRA